MRKLHAHVHNTQLIFSRLFARNNEQLVRFRCNICGRISETILEKLTREEQTCKCRSTVRQRSIIYLLSRELFKKPLSIPEFPESKHVMGLDMSGAENYAKTLAEKLTYTNTYLHKPPYLDIRNPHSHLDEKFNFVISSDVLEHVPSPVSLAFSNLFRLLKPGGVLFLTVPYTTEQATREHFPQLHQYHLQKQKGVWVLHNVTREGSHQEFRNLCFHGGEGETLEMRVFSETGLINELGHAGFVNIRFHSESYPPYGIHWPQPWSLPITARRPV